MSKQEEFAVRVRGKEIPITETLYETVHEFYKSATTLDTLADRVGLDGWEEAYELVSGIPQWLLWLTPSQLEEFLKGARPRTHKRTRRRAEESEKETPEKLEGEKPEETEPAKTGETESAKKKEAG